MEKANLGPSPDTMITIKMAVNNGENRRFKLPLHELQPNTLPDKLRSLLGVPPGQTVTYERFSDSTGQYIKLDSDNAPVYKQLFRAAKAKLKLRMRATIIAIPPPVPTEAPTVDTATNATQLLRDLSPSQLHTLQAQDSSIHPKSLQVYFQNLERKRATEQALEIPPHQAPGLPAFCQTSQCCADAREPQRQAYAYTPLASSPNTKLSSFETEKASNGGANAEVKKEADDEAPVPRFFNAREQFYAELASMTSKDNKGILFSSAQPFAAPGTSFTICCNNCNVAIPNAHYHCSKCDDGDYDLCEGCYDRQVRCNGDEHWLVKRFVKDGKVTSSSTETVTPKKSSSPEIKKEVPGASEAETKAVLSEPVDLSRTCNSCVGIYDESNFVTCTECEDFDLCIPCHIGMKHGHHPAHAFMPASEGSTLNTRASKLLGPGRNVRHAAICDECDKDIYGVRHKCMSCPDWDLCSNCIAKASSVHPGHRFAALYEPITTPTQRQTRHFGIHCDGPLCVDKGHRAYITGDRYKCAVCHDTDFCASCEALPTTHHNRTHPLIKFKTPVRNVSVTTLGEKDNGEHSYTVGDRLPAIATSSKSTETNPAAPSANAATQVHTIAEVKPTEPVSPLKQAIAKEEASPPTSELQAHFLRDAIADGSILAPSTQFEQVWTVRNPGPHAWPAGCSVRFIGGDSMLNVDPNLVTTVNYLGNATESNAIDRVVEVGEEVDFKVVMRTSARQGKAISYWRLKAADGFPFGHKLWCDINVRTAEPEKVEAATLEPEMEEVTATQPSESTMIFPKLDKESPVSSTHEAASSAPSEAVTAEEDLANEVENLALDDSETDDGFLTDEEYEMLSASEDEFKVAKNGKK